MNVLLETTASTLTGHKESIYSIVMNPEGSVLISGSTEKVSQQLSTLYQSNKNSQKMDSLMVRIVVCVCCVVASCVGSSNL